MNYEDIWRTCKKHIKRKWKDTKGISACALRANFHPLRVVKRPQRTAHANHCGYCQNLGSFYRLFAWIERLRLNFTAEAGLPRLYLFSKNSVFRYDHEYALARRQVYANAIARRLRFRSVLHFRQIIRAVKIKSNCRTCRHAI